MLFDLDSQLSIKLNNLKIYNQYNPIQNISYNDKYNIFVIRLKDDNNSYLRIYNIDLKLIKDIKNNDLGGYNIDNISYLNFEDDNDLFIIFKCNNILKINIYN